MGEIARFMALTTACQLDRDEAAAASLTSTANSPTCPWREHQQHYRLHTQSPTNNAQPNIHKPSALINHSADQSYNENKLLYIRRNTCTPFTRVQLTMIRCKYINLEWSAYITKQSAYYSSQHSAGIIPIIWSWSAV